MDLLAIAAQLYCCNGRDASEAPFSVTTNSAGDNHSRVSRRQLLVVKRVSLIYTTQCLFTKRFSAVSIVPLYGLRSSYYEMYSEISRQVSHWHASYLHKIEIVTQAGVSN